MDLETLLQALYDSEINVQIQWCWDAKFDVAIGNAYCCGMPSKPEASAVIRRAEGIAPWLIETAKRLYPDSEFTRNINTEKTK